MLRLEHAKNKFKLLGAIVIEHNLQSLILNSIGQHKIGAILLTNKWWKTFSNPISTRLFYLVVALGGVPPPSIKFDPDILEH